LKGCGFQVIDAETRGQVLEALVAGSLELVVLSLVLGGDDLEDIARAIASPSGHTALIVLTENGAVPDGLRSYPRFRAIDKPFSVTALLDLAVSLVPVGLQPASDFLSL
jgi:DNA-binding NtrC family response regulator